MAARPSELPLYRRKRSVTLRHKPPSSYKGSWAHARTGNDPVRKPIIEPGDVAKGAHGDWRGAARAVAQEADFLGRGLVSPYSTLTNTINKNQSIGGGLRDQALDIRNPSQGAIRYEQQLPRKLQESAINRQRHPVGLAERLANKVTRP